MKTSSVPVPLLRTILSCRKEFPTLSMSLLAAVTERAVCVCVNEIIFMGDWREREE